MKDSHHLGNCDCRDKLRVMLAQGREGRDDYCDQMQKIGGEFLPQSGRLH
jgi:hypothetical protein